MIGIEEIDKKKKKVKIQFWSLKFRENNNLVPKF